MAIRQHEIGMCGIEVRQSVNGDIRLFDWAEMHGITLTEKEARELHQLLHQWKVIRDDIDIG